MAAKTRLRIGASIVLFLFFLTPTNVAALVNSSGTIQEGYKYRAYGEGTVLTGAGNDDTWFTADDDTATTSAIGNPYLYTARRLDSETMLLYFRIRIYRTDTGIFLSRDPIGYIDGMSLYLAYFVPDGRDPMGLRSAEEFSLRVRSAVFGDFPTDWRKTTLEIDGEEVTPKEALLLKAMLLPEGAVRKEYCRCVKLLEKSPYWFRDYTRRVVLAKWVLEGHTLPPIFRNGIMECFAEVDAKYRWAKKRPSILVNPGLEDRCLLLSLGARSGDSSKRSKGLERSEELTLFQHKDYKQLAKLKKDLLKQLLAATAVGIAAETQALQKLASPVVKGLAKRLPKLGRVPKAADTIPEGFRISPYRVTRPGETFIRYESGNPAYTRITPSGGVKPGTFAAPASDGVVPLVNRATVYNLPSPQIQRPNVITLTPSPGTPVIGPRPVAGGTGNEVIFWRGYWK